MAELEPISIHQLVRASGNANALDVFVNANASTIVFRPAAEPIETLEYWRNYMSALAKGADGVDAAITSMTVATGAAGTAASVVTGGTPTARTFALTIPRGDKGLDGSFTQKAYTTYAAMDADKVNIPANTSVTVTNDTGTAKNGLYAYDGTAFTKSAYDPLTQGKAYTDTNKADTLLRVQNVFATKALMTASALVDGSSAQVNNDTTADNNGFYKKTAGAWVKSIYDPLTQAKADATAKADNAKAGAIAEAAIDAENKAKAEVSKVAAFNNAGNNAYIFADAEESVLAVLNSNAEFEAKDFCIPSGSLSDALKVSTAVQLTNTELASAVVDESGTILSAIKTNADVISPHPPLQGFGVDAIRSQLLDNDSLNRAGAYLDRVASQHIEPMHYEVLVAADKSDGLFTQRMGTIQQITPSRFYVVFTQFGRANSDNHEGRLVGRFVDVNFAAKTSVVGETRIIYDALAIAQYPPAHPHIFKVKDGYILIFNYFLDMVTYKSTDDCMTWTEISRYVPTVTTTFWLAPDGVTIIPDGLFKGRIVACGFAYGGGVGIPSRLRSIFSDDGGLSWQEGYNVDPTTIGLSGDMNETGVTTGTNNDLLMVVRNENIAIGGAKMTWLISVDGGKSFKVFNQDTPTFATTCQTGITQAAPYVWQGVPKIITTTPSHYYRNGLVLRMSYNNAQSWAVEYQLYPKELTTGYTSVKAIDQHTLAIVCEYGGFNANSNIAVKFINYAEIYK